MTLCAACQSRFAAAILRENDLRTASRRYCRVIKSDRRIVSNMQLECRMAVARRKCADQVETTRSQAGKRHYAVAYGSPCRVIEQTKV